MIIILLDETEGELVIDQEVVYSERKESAQIFNNILYIKLTVNIKQPKLSEVANTTRECSDSTIQNYAVRSTNALAAIKNVSN